jgi:hypothetical protein
MNVLKESHARTENRLLEREKELAEKEASLNSKYQEQQLAIDLDRRRIDDMQRYVSFLVAMRISRVCSSSPFPCANEAGVAASLSEEFTNLSTTLH